MLYKQSDVKRLGTVLGVWAHPDDEIFSCAGLMHAACLNGQKVISITATYGDAGESADENKWPKSELSNIRKSESEKAIELIGNVEQHWLGFEDGKLSEVDIDEAINKIYELVSNEKINTIITFEEQGITGHEDHKTVHKWSVHLAKKLGVSRVLCSAESQEFYETHGKKLHEKHNIYFNIDKPNCVCKVDADVCFELPEEFKKVKMAALKAHASQTSKLFSNPDSAKAIAVLAEAECFINAA